MTENTTIMGGSIEPREGSVSFPSFYTGTASIRDHGDYLEIAFFTTLTSPRRPSKGKVDGTAVTVTGIFTRGLDPEAPPVRRRDALHAVVANVVVEAPE